MADRPITYRDAGVDRAGGEAAKAEMATFVGTGDARVLNRVGAFASLVDGAFPELRQPVLVLKMEEPGSKQLLALEHDRAESLAEDLIHHLIDDIVVMGARPLAVLDTIVCGGLDAEVVVRLVRGMAAACRAQGCSLVGGETSEQPGVLAAGRFVLAAAGVGIVDREAIVDGGRIEPGDTVLAVSSNGLHTNGYTLVRRLLAEGPGLAETPVEDTTFLEAVLRPHTCYWRGVEALLGEPGLVGMAHVTGGGIAENLVRILPEGRRAEIELDRLRVPAVFGPIRRAARLDDAEMLATFNMGVGLAVVVRSALADEACTRLAKAGYEAYPIGQMAEGAREVRFRGALVG